MLPKVASTNKTPTEGDDVLLASVPPAFALVRHLGEQGSHGEYDVLRDPRQKATFIAGDGVSSHTELFSKFALSEPEEEPLLTKLPTGQAGLGYLREQRPSISDIATCTTCGQRSAPGSRSRGDGCGSEPGFSRFVLMRRLRLASPHDRVMRYQSAVWSPRSSSEWLHAPRRCRAHPAGAARTLCRRAGGHRATTCATSRAAQETRRATPP